MFGNFFADKHIRTNSFLQRLNNKQNVKNDPPA